MTAVKKSFPVSGMTCASCAVNVENMLAKQKGVKHVAVNFANNSAMVEFENITTALDLKNAVQSIGYDLDITEHQSPEELDAKREKEYRHARLNMLLSFVFALPVFVLGMFFHHYEKGRWVSLVLSGVVVFYFGRNFFVHAIKQARHLKTNMDTLVALSTGVSFFYSAFNTLFPQVLLQQKLQPDVYFESAAVITAFILLGKFLEEKAKSNTSTAIRKLMGLQPKTVRVKRNGTETEVRMEDVQRNETIVLRPGEKVPVDGIVAEGNSFVNESMINGEPLAQHKQRGDKVFAGTINQKGSLTITANKVGRETMLAQIISTVQQAQGSKAPVQKTVDKIAAVFVPIVISIALFTFAVWLIVGGKNHLAHALISMVSVLVIACPCALGLATPTAIMVGVGKGAEHGILIRNTGALENAQHINTIVLDKTGTITKGKPEVSAMVWVKSEYASLYAPVLAAIEKKSEHPLAEAVAKHLASFTTNAPVESFEAITGKGVRAVSRAQTFFVGSEQLMSEKLVWVTDDIKTTATEWKAAAQTVIYFSRGTELLAVAAIADALKETSAAAVAELNKTCEVIMLTGDNTATAAAVAAQAGIKNFKAEVLPNAKAKYIEQQKAAGKRTAMVGDGINDSEALAVADISFAMGKGTDIAMNVADITLMNSDLMSVKKALRLSAQINSTIRQNLFWAFIYNLVGIPVAAGVLYPLWHFQLSPMVAAAAMAFSSVSVVSNSLLLKWKGL